MIFITNFVFVLGGITIFLILSRLQMILIMTQQLIIL